MINQSIFCHYIYIHSGKYRLSILQHLESLMRQISGHAYQSFYTGLTEYQYSILDVAAPCYGLGFQTEHREESEWSSSVLCFRIDREAMSCLPGHEGLDPLQL